MKRYNGYTNNATWRVMTEILGDLPYNKLQTEDSLKKIVEWYVFGEKKIQHSKVIMPEHFSVT